jgi:ubiquinone biosynthesis protein
MAEKIPTLHKLGQILARNRYLDPAFRKWLIRLENGIGNSPVEPILEKVRHELVKSSTLKSVNIDDTILSEASVGAVVGFTWPAPDGAQIIRGVFKVVKPGIETKLQEEFDILEKLADYFVRRKDRYPLKDFLFREICADIRAALEKELALDGEQAHLRQAAHFYRHTGVEIPGLLPLCTDQMTAMTLVAGDKITDVVLMPEDRARSARALFRAVVWHPLITSQDRAIFHGDPHAGNIFAAPGDPRPVLLDWSMAGVLLRQQRLTIIRLVQHILLEDPAGIYNAIYDLSVSDSAEKHWSEERIKKAISEVLSEPEYAQATLLFKAFTLVDRLAVKGIRFPQDLLLFRKAFFTVDGILHDLDPNFNMDTYLFALMGALAAEELPQRWLFQALPWMDHPANYKSNLANIELQVFFLRCLAKLITKRLLPMTASAHQRTCSVWAALTGLVLSFAKFPFVGFARMPVPCRSSFRDSH